MLARVANSLYWTGRYIERSENLARYIKVQYFSTFDAPITQQKDVILRSILYMSAAEGREALLADEQKVLTEVAFNSKNGNSIFSNVKAARENARSVRYAISSELWEIINSYYHYVKSYDIDYYKTRGLYDFTTNVSQYCSIIRSYAHTTLLHDEVWAFFKLGIYLERAVQTLRILSSKNIDIQLLTSNGKDVPLTAYQWAITLRIFETFDMYRKLYKGNIKAEHVLNFLLSNTTLSRSLAFSLDRVSQFLSHLTAAISSDSKLLFQAEKLASSFKFLEYEEIQTNLQEFLSTSLNKIYALNDLIEQQYFKIESVDAPSQTQSQGSLQ
ncbi:MAG: alpha-E domain-containing protein [Bacteroidota bacterium]